METSCFSKTSCFLTEHRLFLRTYVFTSSWISWYGWQESWPLAKISSDWFACFTCFTCFICFTKESRQQLQPLFFLLGPKCPLQVEEIVEAWRHHHLEHLVSILGPGYGWMEGLQDVAYKTRSQLVVSCWAVGQLTFAKWIWSLNWNPSTLSWPNILAFGKPTRFLGIQPSGRSKTPEEPLNHGLMDLLDWVSLNVHPMLTMDH